jgi:peptidoglycan biosynthesis protein MviN/MurJ (putative lipid II flippase)
VEDRQRRRSRTREVVRHTSGTSVAAALGVASGLLLDVVIAASFGAGTATDAFFVAARIPLGIAAILLVGANQALVPAISTWLVHRTRHETWRLTTATMLATLLLGTALALAATLLSGPLIAITAPGLDEASSSLAVQLSRILFWTVPLIAVAEVLRALLNALHSFVAPALMHVVLNGVAAAIVIGGVAGSGTGVVQTSTSRGLTWPERSCRRCSCCSSRCGVATVPSPGGCATRRSWRSDGCRSGRCWAPRSTRSRA